jgi:hypothetical protein
MTHTSHAEANPRITRAHCNTCGPNSNHDVLAVERRQYWDGTDDYVISCYDSYEMLNCRNCEAVSMRVTWRHIEDSESNTKYYPPAIARRALQWLEFPDILNLPMNLFHLIDEVYIAVQNDLPQLAAMGIRALLELVMKNKIGDKVREKPAFQELIDEFQKAGYLSTRDAGIVGTILQAGHEAVHHGWEPTQDDIATLLDISEAVIARVYLHEHRAQALEAKLPKRPKRK